MDVLSMLSVRVIRGPSDTVNLRAPIICFDLEYFESVPEVLKFLKQNLIISSLILIATGTKGYDLSPVMGYVHGIISRPLEDTSEAWFKAVQSCWMSYWFPEYEDELDPKLTAGGVSKEEFEYNRQLEQEELEYYLNKKINIDHLLALQT